MLSLLLHLCSIQCLQVQARWQPRFKTLFEYKNHKKLYSKVVNNVYFEIECVCLWCPSSDSTWWWCSETNPWSCGTSGRGRFSGRWLRTSRRLLHWYRQIYILIKNTSFTKPQSWVASEAQEGKNTTNTVEIEMSHKCYVCQQALRYAHINSQLHIWTSPLYIFTLTKHTVSAAVTPIVDSSLC